MMMTPTSTILESTAMTGGDRDNSSSRTTSGSAGGREGSVSSSSSMSLSIPVVGSAAATENIPSTSSPDDVIHESLHESMNSSSQDLHARHHHPHNNSNPPLSSSQNSKNDTTTQRRQANSNSSSNSSSSSVVNPVIVSHSSNGRRRYRKIFVWVVVAGCIIGCYQNLFVQSVKTIKKTPSLSSSSSGVGIGTTNNNKTINATTTSSRRGESDSSPSSPIVQQMTDVTSTTATTVQVHEGSIGINDNDNYIDTNETINSKRTIGKNDTLRSPSFGLARSSRVVQLEEILSSSKVNNSSVSAAGKIEKDRLAVMKSNTRQRIGNAVVVVVEPPNDIEYPLVSSVTEQTTMNNSSSVDKIGRTTMELVLSSSSSLDDDDEGEGDEGHLQHYPDNNYRAYERDWFEKCEDVTTTKRVVSTHDVHSDDIHDNDHRIVVHPTCNQFHELDVASDDDVESHHGSASVERTDSTSATPISNNVQLLSMQGSWRSVWKISTALAPNSTSVILKMLQLDREFDEESFQMHQMDAIVMDKLTASSRIVDSYGFCGQSVMTQTATISSGGKALKGGEDKKASKGSSDSQSSWVDRLKIARDIAHGLAELHALTPYDLDIHRNQSSSFSQGHLRKTKISTSTTTIQDLVFAHHDINPSNMIGVDGRVLFNDFNLGILKRQRIGHPHNQGQNTSDLVEAAASENSTVCPVPIRYYSSLWRSPEEIENKTGYLEDTSTNPHASQAADVYSLGNLLFIILTKHQPWWHLEEPTKPTLDEIAMYKLEGRLPHVPDKFLSSATTRNSDDVGGSNNGTGVLPILAAQGLWTITKMCFRLNPSNRPTALEVAILLDRAYRDENERIKNKEPKSTPKKTRKVYVKKYDEYSDKTKDKDKAIRRRMSKTG